MPPLPSVPEDLVAVAEHLAALERGSLRRLGLDLQGRRVRVARRGRGGSASARDRAAAERGRRGDLAHLRHAFAEEADHLVLLAQVGHERVERARQHADLVTALDRDGARVRAVADPLDEPDQLAHRPGDARRRAPRGQQPERHDAERDGDEHVAEAAERDRLRGQAAQRERGADRLAGGARERRAHADVALARELDLERHVRLRHLRQRERRGERGLERAERRDRDLLGLAGWPHQERHVAVRDLVHLRRDRLAQPVACHHHAHELGARLHRHGDRGEELVALQPERGRVVALERLLDDRVLREVVARVRRAVGARDQLAVRVGRHHEVGGEVLAALAERVERRVLVALGDRRLEVGIVGQHAHAEPQLLEAVVLDGMPDVARFLEAGVDRAARELVGLDGGEGQRAADEQHHQRGDEQQDLARQSHRVPRSFNTSRRPRSPCRTCSCAARA
jgi:hypothetical protein